MRIEYRPADAEEELKPIANAFFELYELKGPSKVRVEPSINKLMPGIMLCPEKGSVIEEMCTRETPATGRLVRFGEGYVTIDISTGQHCAVFSEYKEPWTRE